MATVTPPQARTTYSVADLIERLGDIPADRIRMHPAPGTATEEDAIRINHRKEGGLCELIDGVLVEKPVAVLESGLALVLGAYLHFFLRDGGLGKAFGSDCMFRMKHGGFRMPDLSVVAAEDIPDGKVKRESITDMRFALAVEILSKTNTKREMEIKRSEYFAKGTQLVWIVDPGPRTVRVYHSVDEFVELGVDDQVDGGDVLPGFSLSIKQWFEEAESL